MAGPHGPEEGDEVGTDSHDMVIIHRVFRRELALLPGLVAGVAPGDTARADRLATHGELLLDVLEHHHEGEDLLLWPLLHERAPEHRDLLTAMDAQHGALHGGLVALREALVRWRATAAADDAAAVATAVEAVRGPLVAHLDAEERDVLPLVDRLLDDPEWGALGERAFGLLAPADALVVLAQMAEECTPEEWSAFAVHLPPPVQEVYAAEAAGVYDRYLAEVRGA